MKKISVFLLINILFLLSGSAWALTISSGEDVGDVDSLIAQTPIHLNGYEAELAWIKSVLSDDIVYSDEDKIDVTSSNWFLTDAADTWAFNFSDDTEYFLVKTGSLKNSTDTRDFLFKNNSALDWAVVYLGDLGDTEIIDIGKISHLSQVNSSPVPEPASMLLLGTGLLGIGAYRRKKASR